MKKKTFIEPKTRMIRVNPSAMVAQSLQVGGNVTENMEADDEGDVKEDRLRYNVWDEDWNEEETQ